MRQNHIIKLLDRYIQSKTLKKEISEKMNEIIKEGDLDKIINILNQKDLFKDDKESFINNVIKTNKIQIN